MTGTCGRCGKKNVFVIPETINNENFWYCKTCYDDMHRLRKCKFYSAEIPNRDYLKHLAYHTD